MSQILLLPDDDSVPKEKPVNVASVPQLSPFRYPGGKTWFVPIFRRWMATFDWKPQLLVEPFTGGGIISLTTAFERLAASVLMVELDAGVSAVWRTILGGDAKRLANEIIHFDLTVESAKRVLASSPSTTYERAFQTLLKNRTAHGGILADGAGVLKHGENGKGILSRWYPQTIAKRITKIAHVADRIRFLNGDAFEAIAEHRANPSTVFFIDPPYTAGGKRAGSRLYKHCEIDHERLFTLCGQLRGDFLMTYDNAPEVRALAHRHGFACRPIAMKNTHHAEMTELLIGRELSWIDARSTVCEVPGEASQTPRPNRKPIRYSKPAKPAAKKKKNRRER